MRTKALIALLLTATAAPAAESWQYRGPAPYDAGNECTHQTNEYRLASNSYWAHGNVHILSAAVPTGDTVTVMTPWCMHRTGHRFDRSITAPWQNADWVANYKARTGIEVISPAAQAERDAAEAAEKAEQQRKLDEAAAARAERDAAGRAEVQAYCATLTRAQLDSVSGRRNCPR